MDRLFNRELGAVPCKLNFFWGEAKRYCFHLHNLFLLISNIFLKNVIFLNPEKAICAPWMLTPVASTLCLSLWPKEQFGRSTIKIFLISNNISAYLPDAEARPDPSRTSEICSKPFQARTSTKIAWKLCFWPNYLFLKSWCSDSGKRQRVSYFSTQWKPTFSKRENSF